jgi:hypothetical protein
MVPPKIPYGGFSPVRFQGRFIKRGLPVDREFFASCGLRPPFVPLASQRCILALSRGTWCAGAPPCERPLPLYPRGPRSGPSYVVSVHPHLIGPMRPTRRPSSISRTSLIRAVFAVRLNRPPRRPASGSVLSLAVLCRHVALRDHGKPVGCLYPVPSPTTRPSTICESLGTSNLPHPPILVEASIFEAYLRFAFAYNLPTCSPPCRSRPGLHPVYGDFYIRASSGLVTRTAAGYHYSGNWASSTGGAH